MRRLAVVFGIVSALGISVGAQQPSERAVVLKVSGMSCASCAKTVEKEAKRVAGVKTASASQPKGEAQITYDPSKTSPEAIAKRIAERTGYKTEVTQEKH